MRRQVAVLANALPGPFRLGPGVPVVSAKGERKRPSGYCPYGHVEAKARAPLNKPCPCGSGRKHKKCCWEHRKCND